IEKMTRKSQEAMQAAAQVAERRGNPTVEPEHLLLVLIQQSEGIVPRLLEKAGVSNKALMIDLDTKLEKLPRVSGNASKAGVSQRLVKIFNKSEELAVDMGDAYISTEHFLLGMLQSGDAEMASFFKKSGVTLAAVEKALEEVRGHQKVTDDDPENKYEVLRKYGRDLTALAAEGKLDPVVGRDEEIRRVIQVLSRRTKNNPVLIGE